MALHPQQQTTSINYYDFEKNIEKRILRDCEDDKDSSLYKSYKILIKTIRINSVTKLKSMATEWSRIKDLLKSKKISIEALDEYGIEQSIKEEWRLYNENKNKNNNNNNHQNNINNNLNNNNNKNNVNYNNNNNNNQQQIQPTSNSSTNTNPTSKPTSISTSTSSSSSSSSSKKEKIPKVNSKEKNLQKALTTEDNGKFWKLYKEYVFLH